MTQHNAVHNRIGIKVVFALEMELFWRLHRHALRADAQIGNLLNRQPRLEQKAPELVIAQQ